MAHDGTSAPEFGSYDGPGMAAASPPNVLLITLDQFRGDCLSSAGHPVVRTPHLDELARHGMRLSRHYSQASPCSPGRASLYTGLYQMNHRVVGNGTPLDRRFDNVARVARRAGYRPTLFGYTDQGIDPRQASGPDDPRLSNYEEILPGFEVALRLPTEHEPWIAWLRDLGYDVPDDPHAVLAGEPERPAEHGVSTFLTDHLLAWIDTQDAPWFAHASYLRPHPPYAAAGHWSTAYDPAEAGMPIPASSERHALHDAALMVPEATAPTDENKLRRMRAQYFGMISDVDDQVGRVVRHLRETGRWDDTVIVVTSDHGEQLGDHGLKQKLGFFESSYHIVGIVRDPRRPVAHGAVVDRFTENVDLLPTLCDLMGAAPPTQCDGVSLVPFLAGDVPDGWRQAAHWEYDWRSLVIGRLAQPGVPLPEMLSRRLEEMFLTVTRTDDAAYVQFGDGTWLCFDLAADPTWRTEVRDPAVVLGLAQEQLVWRGRHADRTLSGYVLERGGLGAAPVDPLGAT
jgi:arylsulfatase A-like enzyme